MRLGKFGAISVFAMLAIAGCAPAKDNFSDSSMGYAPMSAAAAARHRLQCAFYSDPGIRV